MVGDTLAVAWTLACVASHGPARGPAAGNAWGQDAEDGRQSRRDSVRAAGAPGCGGDQGG